MPDLATLMGLIVAVFMTGVAFVSWRKAMNFHLLLTESTKRMDGMRAKGLQLTRDLEKTKEKLEEARSNQRKLEKNLHSKKQAKADELEGLKKSNQTLSDDADRSRLKLEHLNKQVEALSSQLKEAEYEKKELQTKLSYQTKGNKEKVNETAEALKAEIGKLKKQNKIIESELSEASAQLKVNEAKFKDFDPKKFKDALRKASHYQNLFKSMRGLREMADERNRNWEYALRRFAAWILRHGGKSQTELKTLPIGPLVGEAMESIGAKLVEDDYSKEEKTAVNRAGAQREAQRNDATP